MTDPFRKLQKSYYIPSTSKCAVIHPKRRPPTPSPTRNTTAPGVSGPESPCKCTLNNNRLRRVELALKVWNKTYKTAECRVFWSPVKAFTVKRLDDGECLARRDSQEDIVLLRAEFYDHRLANLGFPASSASSAVKNWRLFIIPPAFASNTLLLFVEVYI